MSTKISRRKKLGKEIAMRMYGNHLVDRKEIATIPDGRMLPRCYGEAMMRWLNGPWSWSRVLKLLREVKKYKLLIQKQMKNADSKNNWIQPYGPSYNTPQPYHNSLIERDIIPALRSYHTTPVAGCVLDLTIRVRRGSYAQVQIKTLLGIWNSVAVKVALNVLIHNFIDQSISRLWNNGNK